MHSIRWAMISLALMIYGLCNAAESSNYSASVEYVRCLAKTYDLQAAARSELAGTKDPTAILMTSVRMSTKAKLELHAMIATLQQLEVTDDARQFVQYLINFYQQKIEINNTLIETASKILGGSKPGVDYGKLMVSMAEASATIEQIDEQIFKLANAFFAVMIDQRPDKMGHTSHLKITRAERAELLKLIDSRFGSSLDQKNRNWIVSGAWLMRSNLKKDFKTSDEPW